MLLWPMPLGSALKCSRQGIVKPYGAMVGLTSYTADGDLPDLSGVSYPTMVADSFIETGTYDIALLGGGKWAPWFSPVYGDYSGEAMAAVQAIYCARIPCFPPTDTTPYSFASNLKCKIYGPTWGVVCQYSTNVFTGYLVPPYWIPDTRLVDPTTLAEYSDNASFYAAFRAASPRSATNITCAAGSSFEFTPRERPLAIQWPYPQVTLAAFWPGLRAGDFTLLPIDQDPGPIDSGDGQID